MHKPGVRNSLTFRSYLDHYTMGPGSTLTVKSDVPTVPKKSLMEFDSRIYPASHMNASRNGGGTIDIQPKFVIDFRRPNVPFTDCLGYIFMIRNLLALATDSPIQPARVQARPKQGQPSSELVDIYFSMLSDVDDESKHPQKFYFQLGDVPGGFGQLLKKWTEMSSKLEPVINSYFGLQYNRSMYQQDKFLTLVRCIEGYHQRKHNSRYVSGWKWEKIADDFDEMISGGLTNVYDNSGMLTGTGGTHSPGSNLKTIGDAYNFTGRFEDSLSGLIQHVGNKHSLRRTLQILIRANKSALKSIDRNPIGKIHEIVETRNYYTHQNPHKKKIVAEGSRLTELTWSIQQLLEFLLLAEIGIDEKQIISKLDRKYSSYTIL